VVYLPCGRTVVPARAGNFPERFLKLLFKKAEGLPSIKAQKFQETKVPEALQILLTIEVPGKWAGGGEGDENGFF
jgi:hypothetical protein